MSESASAMLSIADANEFRFARFYIVCEAVMLGDTKKSAHCLRRVGHTPNGETRPNVEETRNQMQSSGWFAALIPAYRMNTPTSTPHHPSM